MPFQWRAIRSIKRLRRLGVRRAADEVERHVRLEHELLCEEVQVTELAAAAGRIPSRRSMASSRRPSR